MKLIIIEDDPELIELYAMMLGDHEIAARATDGVMGLERVLAMPADLVLLDLAMPGLDGLELLVRLRQAAPERRVLVVSGFDRHVMAPIVRDLGAVGYVQKGAAPDELRAAVAEAGRQEPQPLDPAATRRLDEYQAAIR